MQAIFPIAYHTASFEKIECKPAPSPDDQLVQIVDPEFSSVCPMTGLPDYATVILQYIPIDHIVELKSWKLFLRSFYGVGLYHETATDHIIKAFVDAVKPQKAKITIKWGARGGLKTITCMKYDCNIGYNTLTDDDFIDNDVFWQGRDWTNR